MIIYRIRRKDGLFSKGGTTPDWGSKGKIWTTKGALSNHLTLVGDFYDHRGRTHPYTDAELITYELTETTISSQSLQDALLERRIAKQKREDDSKRRREEYQREIRQKEFERLKKEFEPPAEDSSWISYH